MKIQTHSVLLTYLIAAGSSLFYCSKGVFVKSAYTYEVDAITILTLRMLIALPFFVVVALVAHRKRDPIPTLAWLQLAGFGFVGY